MKFQRSLIVLLCFLVVLRAQKDVDVDIGTNVNLKCLIILQSNTNPTKFQWFGPQNQFISSNINLIIPNLSFENQGKYTCLATQINNGEVISSKYSVNVRMRVPNGVKNDLREVSVPKVYRTYATGITFLKCQPVKGKDQEYTFEWVSPDGEKQLTNSFFKKEMKLTDAGRYVCRMTRKSDGMVSEAHTLVSVDKLPIKVENISGSLILGKSVILKCEVDKAKTNKMVYTKFSYTWKDPQNRVISNNPIVDIKLNEESQFGKYECTVSASSISPPYIQTEEIDIQNTKHTSKDVSDLRERNVRASTTKYRSTIKINPPIHRYFQPLEVKCLVYPELSNVTYEIFFEDKLKSNTDKYIIPFLGKENLGTYKCVVNGKDFVAKQSVKVESTFSIQPDYETSQKVELEESPGPQIFVHNGDKKEMHCEVLKASGFGGKDAIWYFNGKEITRSDYAKYNLQILAMRTVSLLVLKDIQFSNEGRYSCNIHDLTKEAYIIVMQSVRSIEVSPAKETRRVGDGNPVEFHCRIDKYRTKNKDIEWTFKSNETGQITRLDSRWNRTDDEYADETSFILLQQAEAEDTGTYICTEFISRDTSTGYLEVTGGKRKILAQGRSAGRLVVTPRILRVESGHTAQFQCFTVNSVKSLEYPVFVQTSGNRSGDSRRMTVEKLESGKLQLVFRALTIYDNGTVFTCRKGQSMADALILVSPICAAGYRYCRNGTCINSAKFCDGNNDCADGSDEDKQFCRQCDPLIKQCEVYNGQSPINPIYQTHWGCDGDDDCGNGFDESKCFGSVLDCGGLSYQCSDGNKTIPKAFVCDKESDCDNGEDETSCVVPTIISEPPESYQLSYRQGDTVDIKCQATGFPLPKIVWRFNWGCLLDEKRMTVIDSYDNKCSTSISTLRISNFQPGEDGIYICEALSGGKRAWSKEYQIFLNF